MVIAGSQLKGEAGHRSAIDIECVIDLFNLEMVDLVSDSHYRSILESSRSVYSSNS